jgi:hypothetical protein
METLTASGVRDSDGVRVFSDEERIPYLEQWVRDYVDKRRVNDGDTVLQVRVDLDESDVKSITIHEECASERAEKEDSKVDTINLANLS